MAGDLTTPAPDSAPPVNQPKYKRLTDSQKAFALKLAKDGLTERAIAQHLGCTQPAVHYWLSQCLDSKEAAGQYLDGQALTMAIKAQKTASAADLIKLLSGRGVLGNETNGPAVLIQIGGQNVDVTIGGTRTFAPPDLAIEAKE